MVRTAGFLALFALLRPLPAAAEQFEGKVTKVISGDTLVITEKLGKKQTRAHNVLLAAVNAPVMGQQYYSTSRESLRRLALRKNARVEWDKYDDRCIAAHAPKAQCRKVGRVVLENGTDLSLQQAKLGMAWVNPDRLGELSTPDRTLYGEAMGGARRRRLGLWHARAPVPPWEFPKTAR